MTGAMRSSLSRVSAMATTVVAMEARVCVQVLADSGPMPTIHHETPSDLVSSWQRCTVSCATGASPSVMRMTWACLSLGLVRSVNGHQETYESDQRAG
jgi:hypothetical protein